MKDKRAYMQLYKPKDKAESSVKKTSSPTLLQACNESREV